MKEWFCCMSCSRKILFFTIIASLSISSWAWAALNLLENGYITETFATYSAPGLGEAYSMTFDNNGNLYLTHYLAGSMWRVTTEIHATEFITNLDSPVGITWGGGTSYGDYLYVVEIVDDNVVKVGLDGTTSNFASMISGGNSPSAIGLDRSGNYDGHLYVGSSSTDHTYEIDTSGNMTMFSDWPSWTTGGGPKDYGFDSMGTYSGLMYASAYFSGTYRDRSGLFSLDTSGNATRFTTDLVAASCIDFDLLGNFGSNMFVMAKSSWVDDWGVWRVASDGIVTKFVTITTASWRTMRFGPDGAMYIAEYDSSTETVTISRIRKIYVDDNAPSDPAPYEPGVSVGEAGLSDPCEDGNFNHPFDSIQKALDYIADNHIDPCSIPGILVKDGFYMGVGNYDIDPNGFAVVIESENGPYSSFIDCNGDGRGFFFENGEEPNTVVDGFFIMDGYSGYEQHGGAIYCDGASPTINNCIIAFNEAYYSGGGVFCRDSNMVITNCEITDNYCEASGAGFCGAFGGTPVLQNCLIAWNDGYASGGACLANDSNAAFINCTIADNYAYYPDGTGGIDCYHSDVNITNSIIWDNYSYSNEQIITTSANVTVSYSDIQVSDGAAVWPGSGNINNDPLFAKPWFYDYHLKSEAGRLMPFNETNGDFNQDGIVDELDLEIFSRFWLVEGFVMATDLYYDYIIDFKDFAVIASNWHEPGWTIGGWVTDESGVYSPCIDTGDPTADFSKEPIPNGGIINMGAYGNTTSASKSNTP